MLYKETEQHGPNFLEPPPDIVEGEPEWEIEQILRERTFGRWKKKQYLVRWKDYSPAHDSWVDETDLHVPELIEEFQSRSGDVIQVATTSDPSSTASTPHPLSTTPSEPQLPEPSPPHTTNQLPLTPQQREWLQTIDALAAKIRRKTATPTDVGRTRLWSPQEQQSKDIDESIA